MTGEGGRGAEAERGVGPGGGAVTAPPGALAVLGRAAGFLGRDDPTCPVHHVWHTGKLARLIVIDLVLCDATGDDRPWEEAVRRAESIASRLTPDPQHGALIYLPGRLDPRNCSTSAIDSGECTDALARLLLHPRAAALEPGRRRRLEETAAGNAGTYLWQKVTETEITNQRLWGAMGLASACRRWGEGTWAAAVGAAVERSLEEQHPDGSWGYQPGAPGQGAFPGAADLTVYYHSRCLAFLFHIADCLPHLDGPRLDGALRRGLDFLAAVITPDGRKPLALEGKRWFWDGPAEAGSNAYDVYALLRGTQRFGVAAWRHLAARSWWQLARHQAPDGSVVAGDPPLRDDFVCPTFHTADLAWPAQVLDQLAELPRSPDSPMTATPGAPEGAWHFPDAGVLRLESRNVVALVRTRKGPRNTQLGGAIGGASLVYVGDRETGRDRLRLDRESPVVEGGFTLYPARPGRRAALLRWRRSDPPGREGRQWLFVARLLLAQGRPAAALSRIRRGYLRPLLQALADPVATHWARGAEIHLDAPPGLRPGSPPPGPARLAGPGRGRNVGRLRVAGQPARPDGSVPSWAAGVTLTREYALEDAGLRVVDRLAQEDGQAGGGPACARVVYLVPAAAQDVRVASSEPVARLGPAGRRVELRPSGATFSMRLAYIVIV